MAASEIPMVGYQSRLLSRAEVAQNTMAFHFEKPTGFDFKPGQSVDLPLINPPQTDSEGNTRTFSIVSATFENQLIFATRMRDTAFKRSLKKVALGTLLKMDAAMGSFTLHKNSAQPAVFLAVESESHRFPASCVRPIMIGGHKIYLLYFNRRPEDVAFLEPLMELEKSNPNFRLIATMTEIARSQKKWNGETSWIDKEMLSRYLSELHGPIFYIAGPPAMVTGTRKMLAASGVAEDDIRTEEFAGY